MVWTCDAWIIQLYDAQRWRYFLKNILNFTNDKLVPWKKTRQSKEQKTLKADSTLQALLLKMTISSLSSSPAAAAAALSLSLARHSAIKKTSNTRNAAAAFNTTCTNNTVYRTRSHKRRKARVSHLCVISVRVMLCSCLCSIRRFTSLIPMTIHNIYI